MTTHPHLSIVSQSWRSQFHNLVYCSSMIMQSKSQPPRRLKSPLVHLSLVLNKGLTEGLNSAMVTRQTAELYPLMLKYIQRAVIYFAHSPSTSEARSVFTLELLILHYILWGKIGISGLVLQCLMQILKCESNSKCQMSERNLWQPTESTELGGCSDSLLDVIAIYFTSHSLPWQGINPILCLPPHRRERS
ncbi:hypothetical protein BGZ63DRAFT_376560, partial [Mariannaea sp. PMI_226]